MKVSANHTLNTYIYNNSPSENNISYMFKVGKF